MPASTDGRAATAFLFEAAFLVYSRRSRRRWAASTRPFLAFCARHSLYDSRRRYVLRRQKDSSHLVIHGEPCVLTRDISRLVLARLRKKRAVTGSSNQRPDPVAGGICNPPDACFAGRHTRGAAPVV